MIAAWVCPFPGSCPGCGPGRHCGCGASFLTACPLILLVASDKSVRTSPRHGSQVLCAHDLIEYDGGGGDRIVCRVIAEHCLCLGVDEDGQV